MDNEGGMVLKGRLWGGARLWEQPVAIRNTNLRFYVSRSAMIFMIEVYPRLDISNKAFNRGQNKGIKQYNSHH